MYSSLFLIASTFSFLVVRSFVIDFSNAIKSAFTLSNLVGLVFSTVSPTNDPGPPCLITAKLTAFEIAGLRIISFSRSFNSPSFLNILFAMWSIPTWKSPKLLSNFSSYSASDMYDTESTSSSAVGLSLPKLSSSSSSTLLRPAGIKPMSRDNCIASESALTVTVWASTTLGKTAVVEFWYITDGEVPVGNDFLKFLSSSLAFNSPTSGLSLYLSSKLLIISSGSRLVEFTSSKSKPTLIESWFSLSNEIKILPSGPTFNSIMLPGLLLKNNLFCISALNFIAASILSSLLVIFTIFFASLTISTYNLSSSVASSCIAFTFTLA